MKMPLKTSEQLHFHDVHGNNIVLENNKTLACREKGFDNGTLFTHRPVMIRERIVFQIKKTSKFFGGLSIGFTSNDPSNLRIEMINDEALFKSYCEVFIKLPRSTNKDDYVVSFYYDKDGFVYYAVNNGKETCYPSVDVSLKLWAIIDLFGIVSKIELLGSSYSLLNIEKKMIEKAESQKVVFHDIHGEHASLSKDSTIAYKNQSVGCDALVFSNRPLQLNDKIIVGFNTHCNDLEQTFEYGVTATDPSKISPNGSTVKTDDLLSFPDFWVMHKDINKYKSEDIIIFLITLEGEFMAIKNCVLQACCLPIDTRQPLWLILKLNAAVSEISIRQSSTEDYCNILIDRNLLNVLPVSDNKENYISCACKTLINNSDTGYQCCICLEEPVNTVVYPCGHMCLCCECAQYGWNHEKILMCPICSKFIFGVVTVPFVPHNKGNLGSCALINNSILFNRCLFCFVNPVNSVLYDCGHMCMCYECASNTWRRKRLDLCPICKSFINDAIKVY